MPPHDSEIAELKKSVTELKESIQELLDAWAAARGMLTVIKWLAGIASGLGAIWAAWHSGSGPH